MKKLLITLFISLLVGFNTVYAEDNKIYTEGYYNYTLENGSITIIGYFGKQEEITIPASIAGYPVNTIAEHAFENADTVKTVNLPDTITTIGEKAFKADVSVVYAGQNISGPTDNNNNNTDNNNNSSNNESTGNGNNSISYTPLKPESNSNTSSNNSSTIEITTPNVTDSANFDEAEVSLDDLITEEAETEKETLDGEVLNEPENKTNVLVYVIPALVIVGVCAFVIIKKLVK